MFRKAIAPLVVFSSVALLGAATTADRTERQFPAAAGGKLVLDLKAGGTVRITGSGGSSIHAAYAASCTPACEVTFEETKDGLAIRTRFADGDRSQHSTIDLDIRVPGRFDVVLDSVGGGLSIDGVQGTFTGKTMGGELSLHDVQGEAQLTTMGGAIHLNDSELEGSLATMGGEVQFENVVGDVKGSSMGGNVRYKNVQRRGGRLASPTETGGLDAITPETVQISTMGGEIDVADAPEGADLHTMGGDITVQDARRFLRAKTMGGDIEIGSIDGWLEATTMGGNIGATVIGTGGDVTLTSMGGDITLVVPSGFGMDLNLEIAYTRNSRQQYRIEAPGASTPTVSPDWDHDRGTPRKYIRSSGRVHGGGNKVTIQTVNGNITIREGR